MLYECARAAVLLKRWQARAGERSTPQRETDSSQATLRRACLARTAVIRLNLLRLTPFGKRWGGPWWPCRRGGQSLMRWGLTDESATCHWLDRAVQQSELSLVSGCQQSHALITASSAVSMFAYQVKDCGVHLGVMSPPHAATLEHSTWRLQQQLQDLLGQAHLLGHHKCQTVTVPVEGLSASAPPRVPPACPSWLAVGQPRSPHSCRRTAHVLCVVPPVLPSWSMYTCSDPAHLAHWGAQRLHLQQKGPSPFAGHSDSTADPGGCSPVAEEQRRGVGHCIQAALCHAEDPHLQGAAATWLEICSRLAAGCFAHRQAGRWI